MENILLINGVEYLKEVIEGDESLKKELLAQLKKEHYRNVAKEKAHLNRLNNKELVNAQHREYQKKKFNEDPEYRAKKQAYNKEYRLKHTINKNTDEIIKKGRPPKFKLDTEFLLVLK